MRFILEREYTDLRELQIATLNKRNGNGIFRQISE